MSPPYELIDTYVVSTDADIRWDGLAYHNDIATYRTFHPFIQKGRADILLDD